MTGYTETHNQHAYEVHYPKDDCNVTNLVPSVFRKDYAHKSAWNASPKFGLLLCNFELLVELYRDTKPLGDYVALLSIICLPGVFFSKTPLQSSKAGRNYY